MSQRRYSESGFWSKMKSVVAVIGRELALLVMTLYYCMTDPKTPAWAKTVIAGALAYFVWPLDAIPDVIVGLGYTDNAAALASAMSTVAACVTSEHRSRARAWVKEVL